MTAKEREGLAIRIAGRYEVGDVPLYPVAVAAAYMLNAYLDSPATVQGLWRPLAVIVLIAAIIQTVAAVLLRNRHRGALLAIVLVALLFAPPTMSLALVGVIAIALAIGLIAGLIVSRLRRKPVEALPWASVTRLLNVVGIVMVAFAFWAALSAGALTASAPPARNPAAQAPSGSPDIYVILLDGYPRADTLMNDFGFDNEPFIQAMAERGFDVSRRSHANYNVTALTIASMLSVAHISEVEPNPPAAPKAQARAIARSLDRAEGVKWLREDGYEIVAVPSPFSYATMYSADRVLDSGDVTEFELSLLQKGFSRFLFADLQRQWLGGSHRHRIRETFATLPELAAERGERPKFVLAHVLAPHLPFVFGPNGEDRGPWPCFPAQCAMWDDGQRFMPGGKDVPLEERVPYVEALRDQVTHVNSLVLATVDEIVANSAVPPVIVVFSDHGHRHDLQDREEVLRSILFARTPGHPGLFPDDATPINVLSRIANAYLDAGLELATEESYFTNLSNLPTDGVFALEPVSAPR